MAIGGVLLALALAPAVHAGMPQAEVERHIRAGKAGLQAVAPLVGQVDWDEYQRGGHPDQAEEILEISRAVMKRDRTAIPVVAAKLRDPDPRTRRGAMELLRSAEIRDDQVITFLDQAVTDPDVTVRFQAAQLLGFQDSPRGDALCRKVLASERDARIRAKAAGSLARHGDGSGMLEIRKLLVGRDVPGRQEASLALGEVPPAAARAVLEERIRAEADTSVLAALVASLRKHTGETDRQVRQRLLGRLW